MKEEWKIIERFEGRYEISNTGKIKSNFKGERILKTSINKYGYERLTVSYRDKIHSLLIHQEVAKAFILNPENKETVNHIDGNKFNNHSANLEWMTHEENMKHGYETGLFKNINLNRVFTINKSGEQVFTLKDLSIKTEINYTTLCQIVREGRSHRYGITVETKK